MAAGAIRRVSIPGTRPLVRRCARATANGNSDSRIIADVDDNDDRSTRPKKDGNMGIAPRAWESGPFVGCRGAIRNGPWHLD